MYVNPASLFVVVGGPFATRVAQSAVSAAREPETCEACSEFVDAGATFATVWTKHFVRKLGGEGERGPNFA